MKFFFFAILLLVSVSLGNSRKDSLVVLASNGAESSVGIWWGSTDYSAINSKMQKNRGKIKDSQEKSSPVAIWFHGGMSSGNCQKGLVAGNDLAKLLPRYTVVSASACKENHWVTTTAREWVDAVLDSVASRRKVPVEKVFLIGVSDGALGTIYYSLEGRRQVVARTLISSYGALLANAPELAKQVKLQTGLWQFIQGGSDRLYPAEETVPWIESFCKGVGVMCNLQFDQKGEHDWSYWKNMHKDWVLKLFPEK